MMCIASKLTAKILAWYKYELFSLNEFAALHGTPTSPSYQQILYTFDSEYSVVKFTRPPRMG